MSDDMVRAAAARLRRRTTARNDSRSARRLRAQRAAREIARNLGAIDPSLQRVIGFGSTFEEWRTFREDSDIDLGLEGGDWFLLARSVPVTEFDVTLVELDLQNLEFSTHVRKEGVVRYERTDS
jgi:hypothetical protein